MRSLTQRTRSTQRPSGEETSHREFFEEETPKEDSHKKIKIYIPDGLRVLSVLCVRLLTRMATVYWRAYLLNEAHRNYGTPHST